MLRLTDYEHMNPAEISERFDRALRVHPEETFFGMHVVGLNAQLELRRCTIKGAPSGGLVLAVTTIRKHLHASSQLRFTKRLPAGRTDAHSLYRCFNKMLEPFTSGLIDARQELYALVGEVNDMGYNKQINKLSLMHSATRPTVYDSMSLEDCAFWKKIFTDLIKHKGKITDES